MEAQCKSCGAPQTSRYCPECGEQRLTPKLRSVGYILRDLFKDITEVDGKVWLTLRKLLFSPGSIDRDFWEGRRKIYMRPITLFLLINVLFVMFSSLSDFYVNFYSQRDLQQYSQWVTPHLMSYIDSQGWDVKDFAAHYDQMVKVLARSLIILQVPIFALFVALICRKKGFFSGDFVTFSLNFHSLFLILFLVIGYPDLLIRAINNLEVLPFNIPYIKFTILQAGMLIYLFFAMRRLFGFSNWQTLWRLPFVVIAYFLSHIIYRFLQLIITTSMIEL